MDVTEYMKRVMEADSKGVPVDWKSVSLQLVRAISASQLEQKAPESTSQAEQ